jgi:phosphate transport system substrate-binding protein
MTFDFHPVKLQLIKLQLNRINMEKNNEQQNLGLTLRLVGFGAFLLLVGGISYGLLRSQQSQPSPLSSSVVPEISRASDIRIYRTIQEVPNVPKGLFNYHNALPFAAIMAKGMDAAIQRSFPEFQMRYTEPRQGNPGSGAAIQMLIDGEVSIASSVRPLKDEEFQRAKERNFTLEQIPVAIDGIVFSIHPNLSVSGLSLRQVQDIYAGKITNWKEVGGPNLAIVPLTLEPKETAAPRQALGDVVDKLGRNVRIARDVTEGMRQVAATPGAVFFAGASNFAGQKLVRYLNLSRGNSKNYVAGFTPTGEANKQSFRDGSYPLTRRSFVVIRRDGSLDERAGVAYANFFLSSEGQKIIETAGLVPLY